MGNRAQYQFIAGFLNRRAERPVKAPQRTSEGLKIASYRPCATIGSMTITRIAVDAAGAAIGDVLNTLRSATPADRVILRSLIADQVAELLGDLAGEGGDGAKPVQAAEA